MKPGDLPGGCVVSVLLGGTCGALPRRRIALSTVPVRAPR